MRLNKTNTRKGSQNLIIFLELAFPFSVKYQKEFLFFSFWKSFSSQQLKIYYWSDCQSVRRAFNTAGVEGREGDFAFLNNNKKQNMMKYFVKKSWRAKSLEVERSKNENNNFGTSLFRLLKYYLLRLLHRFEIQNT